uniref:Down syndrome cell adhesion molecule n=1 Tax=Strigamia maritima TaxID=126957 RepID=T1IX57_STRMM
MYVCVASNIIGAAKAETALTVIAPLRAHIQPTLNIISIGKSTTIHCIISGSPINSVTWFKNGQPIKNDGITYLSRDIIRIAHTDIDDAGMYQCVLKNDFESVQATAELRFGEVFPEIHHGFRDIVAQPGENVSLQCIASGSPAPLIDWLLEDRIMDSLNIDNTVNSEGDTVSTLNILQAKVEDGGLYICFAINGLGRVQHQARLNIYGSLAVRPNSKHTLVAGKDALLNCPFYGYPVDSIVWLRAGETLPIDLRQQVLENGTLKLREVQRSVDNGNYTCIVSNKDGLSAKGDIYIDVVVPVKIMPFSFQGNLLTEGMRARLQCVVAEGDPPITLKWMKDNHPLSPEFSIQVRSLDDFSSMLTITNVTPRHNGNYTCIAANSVSQDLHSTSLKINVPPKWILNPKNESVFAGQSASFHCRAEGFPIPTIKWFRAEGVSRSEQELVHTNHEYQVFHNGTLHIPSARTQHRGFFFVKRVMEWVPPVAERKKRDVSGRVGSSFQLQCTIIGEKPINFTWKVDGKNIDVEKTRYKSNTIELQNKIISELTILNIIKEDALSYVCTAGNDFGQDECAFRLKVLEPPFHPNNLTIKEIGNGSVLAQWTEPYNGKSPITQYVIQYKEVSEGKDITDKIQNNSVSGGFTSMHIPGLKPATKYEFRILAVNQLGRSEPGRTVVVTMEDEAPLVPPSMVKVDVIDEKTLRVSWKPPDRMLWNGNINAYYVGHKITTTSEPFEYHHMDITDNLNETFSHILSDLKTYTQYTVTVTAVNSGGIGPSSDDVLAMTSEGVPSKPPSDVRCSMLASQSIHLTWQPPSTQSVNGILKGFKVLYQPIKDFYDVPEYHYLSVSLPKAILQNLHKFTNYSISVLAFTMKGDGVKSESVFCQTLEDVPESPADIKVLAASVDSVLVSYKLPYHPNGVISKYNIYVHLKGENDNEKGIIKHTVDGNVTYYEVRGLSKNVPYEFWVTALTKTDEGPPSKIVECTLDGNSIISRIASFSETVTTTTRRDLKLACRAVGVSFSKRKWIYKSRVLRFDDRKKILPDGELLLQNVQKDDDGNYTCQVGNDSIMYSVVLLSRPDPLTLEISSVSLNFIEVKWRVTETGRTPVTYFILYIKKDGVWVNQELDAKERKYKYENLYCGTIYQTYIIVHNVLGPSEQSNLLTVKTNGSVPELPLKEKLLQEGVTSLTINLDAWKSSICPIQHFVIEYRLYSKSDWVSIRDNVSPSQQKKLVIKNLHKASEYQLRITAFNAAGSSRAEYRVTTLSTGGAVVHSEVPNQRKIVNMFVDERILIPASLSLLTVIIVLILTCICIRILHKTQRKKMSISVIEYNSDDVEPFSSSHLFEMQPTERETRSNKCISKFSKQTKPTFEQALRLATGSRESCIPLLSAQRHTKLNGDDVPREETTFVFFDLSQEMQLGTSNGNMQKPTQVQRNKCFMW